MKNARLIVLAISLSIATASLAQLDARTIIQANYDKVSRLSIKKDSINLERLARKNASSSFEFIDAMQNSMDLAATVRQNSEQLTRVHKFISNSNKIVGVKRQGKVMVCTVKTSYDVFLDPTFKNRMVGTSISEDTWINTLTGWKLRTSKVVKESTSQNGKLLQSNPK